MSQPRCLALSDHLSTVQLDVSASGKADGNVAFGFSPRRGLGRAICVLDLHLNNNGFTAGISAPSWNASSPVTLEQVGEDPYISYELRGRKITATFSPSLPSLLLHDLPKIDLTCPVPGAAANLVDLVGLLAGIPNEFSLPVPSIKGVQVIPLPKLSIGEQRIRMTLRPLTAKAIIAEGRLEK